MSSAPAMPIPSPPRDSEDIDSACSTPFVSAPSSPGHSGAPPSGYFFSAPASPMHFLLCSSPKKSALSSVSPEYEPVFLSSETGSFEFSSRFSPKGHGSSMTSADELFFNGQIRPMKLSSHLEDAEVDAEVAGAHTRGRDTVRGAKGLHRKSRSMSPLRTTDKYKADCEWPRVLDTISDQNQENIEDAKESESSSETTPPDPASSSRSSSSGRNSKKWIFLKDLLHRSKSEGRAVGSSKERFWASISFASPAKDKKKATSLSPSSSRDEKKGNSNAKAKAANSGKPTNGVWRRKLSAHEMHYTANRAQAEEMKKKTFLPYRQGLLGCLGFSSKSYGAFSGFTKNLSPISSR